MYFVGVIAVTYSYILCVYKLRLGLLYSQPIEYQLWGQTMDHPKNSPAY